jgi:hypothetical protein
VVLIDETLYGSTCKVAHALHGKAKQLIYRSPVIGDVVIFAHDPFWGEA